MENVWTIFVFLFSIGKCLKSALCVHSTVENVLHHQSPWAIKKFLERRALQHQCFSFSDLHKNAFFPFHFCHQRIARDERRKTGKRRKIWWRKFAFKENEKLQSSRSSWRTLDINLRRFSFRDFLLRFFAAFEIFMKVQFPLLLSLALEGLFRTIFSFVKAAAIESVIAVHFLTDRMNFWRLRIVHCVIAFAHINTLNKYSSLWRLFRTKCLMLVLISTFEQIVWIIKIIKCLAESTSKIDTLSRRPASRVDSFVHKLIHFTTG